MKYLLLISVLLMSGCDFSKDKTNQRLKIADISFVSSTVEQCVGRFIERFNYVYADELTSFFCDASKYSTTADLKHFPNVKGIGFDSLLSSEGIDSSDFPQITRLSISNSSITSIDLAALADLQEIDFSNNVRLVNLDLSYNSRLKKVHIEGAPIEELNLENNFELEEFVFYGSFFIGTDFFKSELNQINLENNINLLTVKILSTQLSSLTLNNHDKLEHLVLGPSPITSLELDLPSLSFLDVIGGEFKQIDLDFLPGLTDLILTSGNLENINFDNNLSLEFVDLRDNPLSQEALAYLDSLSGIEIKL